MSKQTQLFLGPARPSMAISKHCPSHKGQSAYQNRVLFLQQTIINSYCPVPFLGFIGLSLSLTCTSANALYVYFFFLFSRCAEHSRFAHQVSCRQDPGDLEQTNAYSKIVMISPDFLIEFKMAVNSLFRYLQQSAKCPSQPLASIRSFCAAMLYYCQNDLDIPSRSGITEWFYSDQIAETYFQICRSPRHYSTTRRDL